MADGTLRDVKTDFRSLSGGHLYSRPTQREETLDTVVDRLESDRDRLVRETVTETDIPRTHVEHEFDAAIAGTRTLGDGFDRHEQQLRMLGEEYDIECTTAPKGRVLIFAPWNSPMLAQIFLPCLSYFAGNPTVSNPG